jgi:inosine-uridine nucleoside N-ribohydrolase
MKIHLDTDFGGDPDDACALAFLLGTPNVELVGITTNLDFGGRRAGCVRRYLELAGRDEIPLVAGAATTLADGKRYDSTADDARFWPRPIESMTSQPDRAVDLLAQSVANGATIVAIGAATNLALLEMQRPGALAHAKVVFMGGWIRPPADGLPPWGPERDWNVQCDQRATAMLEFVGDLTLVTLPATLKTALRAAHLSRLKQCGPVGRLLAHQSGAYAKINNFSALARNHSALPADLVNFHYDPLTAAVAAGWPGVVLEEHALRPVIRDDVMRFEPGAGPSVRVVVDADGDAFAELWLQAIERFT